MRKPLQLALLTLILYSGLAAQSTPNSMSDLEGLEGKTAPAFVKAAMDETEYDSAKLAGKIIVINLWATFCEPCITEMPDLNALTIKYKDKDVVFLAPSPEEKDLLKGFLSKYEFNYAVLPASFNIIEDYAPKKKSKVAGQPGSFIMLLPTHLVVDKYGVVYKHFWGFSLQPADNISKALDELLAKKAK